MNTGNNITIKYDIRDTIKCLFTFKNFNNKILFIINFNFLFSANYFKRRKKGICIKRIKDGNKAINYFSIIIILLINIYINMKISPDILNILYTLYVKFVELLLILDPCD